MLKSVYLVSFNSKFTCEKIFKNKRNAITSITSGGIIDGLGIIPCFYNGERVRSRKALIEALKAEQGQRVVTKIQWCSNESQGFERALSIRTFKNMATFERSVYCRNFSYFTDSQKHELENLIK